MPVDHEVQNFYFASILLSIVLCFMWGSLSIGRIDYWRQFPIKQSCLTNILPIIVITIPDTTFSEFDKCPISSNSISPVFTVWFQWYINNTCIVMDGWMMSYARSSISMNELTDKSIICHIVHELNSQCFICWFTDDAQSWWHGS